MFALNKKTGYALIAMAHLAGLEPGEVASAREIAERFDVPRALLTNVMKQLAAARYLDSVRGVRGGYRLARAPEAISLAGLVTAIEGPIRLAECVAVPGRQGDRRPCRRLDDCPIADPVHRVHRRLSDFLKTVTLADIAGPALKAANR